MGSLMLNAMAHYPWRTASKKSDKNAANPPIPFIDGGRTPA